MSIDIQLHSVTTAVTAAFAHTIAPMVIIIVIVTLVAAIVIS